MRRFAKLSIYKTIYSLSEVHFNRSQHFKDLVTNEYSRVRKITNNVEDALGQLEKQDTFQMTHYLEISVLSSPALTIIL